MLATLLKRDSNTGVFLWILQTLKTPISKNICQRLVLIVVIYCIENWFKLFRKRIGLPDWSFASFETYNHNILPTLNRIHSFYHSLSFTVTHCHFLSLVVTRHSLSLALPLFSVVVIRSTTRCHSLSLVVIRSTTRCQSLSLVVIRYHSMYHSSVFL